MRISLISFCFIDFPQIAESILFKLDESVRHKCCCEIITSFSKDVSEVDKLLLSENGMVSETAARIIVFLGNINPSILVHSIGYVLQNSTNPEHLVILIKILTNELIDKTQPPYCEKGGHFSVVLEHIVSRNIKKFFESNEETSDLSLMWENLLTLLKWEKSGKIPLLNARLISTAIENNLVNLTSLFGTEHIHMHVIADIFDLMDVPNPESTYRPPIQVILNMTQSTVNYFFACCKDEGTSRKVKGFKKVSEILKRLCAYSKISQVMALRELLERALFRSDHVMFGARNNNHESDGEKMLLKQNKKIVSWDCWKVLVVEFVFFRIKRFL